MLTISQYTACMVLAIGDAASTWKPYTVANRSRYRTHKTNHDEDSTIPEATRQIVPQPTLFVACEKDDVLTPAMSSGMEQNIPLLTRASVPASHWALWHTPKETNDAIKRWVEGVVFGGKSKL